jgi:cytochrome c-type biogenesis protein
MDSQTVNVFIAFFVGFLTFFTPCFLPLLPAYLSFISGVSIGELQATAQPKRILVINTLFFILGFSIIFILLGASVTYLGGLLHAYRTWVRVIGGAIIMLFGVFLLGGFSARFLERERRFQLRSKPAGYLGSVLVGAAFAAGWSPCIGPILGSILVYAGTSDTLWYGIVLLIVYSAGLGLPLLISALLVDSLVKKLGNITRYIRVFSVVSGVVLIIMGLILVTDPFHMLR